ncbi:hypothetical protein Tco_1278359 [Tanacetum coccineum]
MNDLTRNKIVLPNATISTKFLNCLQPEWYKYLTSVRLARNVRDKLHDELFDYLQQYENIVIASRAKKLEKIHDPLALVAHIRDTFQNDLEDTLTSAMMLLARAITQRYSTPINNRLRHRQTQGIKQLRKLTDAKGHHARDCLKPIVWDSKYFMEQMLLVKKDEVGFILFNEQNDFLIDDAAQIEEIEELSANICMMSRIQQANTDSDEGPSYDSTH